MDMQLLTVAEAEHLVGNRSFDWSHSREDFEVMDSASPIRPSISCRAEAWQRRKDERTKELRETLNDAELRECSFHPKVRRSSGQKFVDVDHLVNRLSVPKKVPQQPVEEELPAECTFIPNMGKSRHSFDRQNMMQHSDSFYSHKSLPNPMQFSHHPNTNAVKDDMLYCRAYLQENVFSRLSRPLEQSEAQAPQESFSRASCSSALPEKWNEFLRRQNEFHREREEWMAEKVEMEEDEMFKPRLCTKSRAMARGKIRSDGPVPEYRGVTRRTSAPSYSFQPDIRPRSKALPRRSSYALSVGDQIKKEDTIRRLREELYIEKASNAEREEYLRATVPRINAVPDDAADALRERVTQRKIERQKAAIERKQQRDAEETNECSFQPKIKPAPAFVRRVAESYRLARQMQGPSEPKPEKARWR